MAKIKKMVPISSVSDLLDLVNHNCDVFERRIGKLAKSNRGLKILCVAAIGCAICSAIECRKQEEELYRLSIRVSKLEYGEGEQMI